MRAVMIILLCVQSICILASEQITLSAEQLLNLGIKLGKLEAVDSVPLLEAPAKVSIPPANEYLVSTSYAGLVSQISASVGDEVVENQLLATIKSPDLLALQQHHLSSINDLQLAKSEYLRDQKLYQEGVIADRRWLQSKTSYQVFMAHFNETRQLLEISGISQEAIRALEKTHKLSSELKVVAPISGVILERMISSGERLDALAPLFRVANLQTLWLDISVPQQHINQVKLGDKVMIEGQDVGAKIFLLAKNVDEQSQTVLVRAAIDKLPDDIRLGQTVNVKISQTSDQAMFKVDNSALAQSAGSTYIFKRTASGFIVQPIKVLGREAQQSIISGDLQVGNEIAIKGAVALKANFLGLGEGE